MRLFAASAAAAAAAPAAEPRSPVAGEAAEGRDAELPEAPKMGSIPEEALGESFSALGVESQPEADPLTEHEHEDGGESKGNSPEVHAEEGKQELASSLEQALEKEFAERLVIGGVEVEGDTPEGSGEGSGEGSVEVPGEVSGEGSVEGPGEGSGEGSGEVAGKGSRALTGEGLEEVSGAGSGEGPGKGPEKGLGEGSEKPSRERLEEGKGSQDLPIGEVTSSEPSPETLSKKQHQEGVEEKG